MGDVIQFPVGPPGTVPAEAKVGFAVARGMIEDEFTVAEVVLQENLWMHGWQQKGRKRSKCQPGDPKISFRDSGVLVEWTIPRSRGRQEFCIFLPYEGIRQLSEILGRLLIVKGLADEINRRERDTLRDCQA